MEINSIFHEVVNSEVPVSPGGWSKKRGKGKPRLSPDSVRRQITMTIELAIWRQFEEKCADSGVTQAEAFRRLMRKWVEEENPNLTPTPDAATI